MMKKQNKWIALGVALAFLWMVHASAMPLRADQALDQGGTSVCSKEQGPSFIEEEGYASTPAKKSIVPFILIGLGVAALAAVLVLVVFKTKYDITGSWNFNFVSTSPAHTWTWSLTFSGDKKDGLFIDEYNDTGTYKVDGKDVSIEYDSWNIKITGKFDDKDRMTGSATFSELTIGGKDITSASWTATRISSSAAMPGMPAVQSLPGLKTRKSGL